MRHPQKETEALLLPRLPTLHTEGLEAKRRCVLFRWAFAALTETRRSSLRPMARIFLVN